MQIEIELVRRISSVASGICSFGLTFGAAKSDEVHNFSATQMNKSTRLMVMSSTGNILVFHDREDFDDHENIENPDVVDYIDENQNKQGVVADSMLRSRMESKVDVMTTRVDDAVKIAREAKDNVKLMEVKFGTLQG